MIRLCTFAVASLIAESAFAFAVGTTESNHIIKWYNTPPTIDIEVDADGPTRRRSGTSLADVNAAIDRAFASWNNATCSNLTLRISGRTNETSNITSGTEPRDRLDRINRMVWIENDVDYPFGASVLGVTTEIYYEDGTVVEADIALNGADNTWIVPDDVTEYQGSGAVDVESVVVHELGHLFGMSHVLGGQNLPNPPTMAPVVDQQLRTQTPEQDDINGVCFLYPTSTYTCDNDDECPRFLPNQGQSDGTGEVYDTLLSECVSGACSNVETVPCGSGNVGERCCSDDACAAGAFCLSLASTTDMAYCAIECDSDGGCPSGFSCIPLSGGGTACLTNSVFGCTCDTSNACTSSCACDTDCGGTGFVPDDGGCAAVQGAWAMLAGLVLIVRRARRR